MRRARPVVLTALAAILAMIPLSSLRLLGADGLHHHGRAVRRDLPDAPVPAGALRAVVPQQLDRAAAAEPEPEVERIRVMPSSERPLAIAAE